MCFLALGLYLEQGQVQQLGLALGGREAWEKCTGENGPWPWTSGRDIVITQVRVMDREGDKLERGLRVVCGIGIG